VHLGVLRVSVVNRVLEFFLSLPSPQLVGLFDLKRRTGIYYLVC